MLKRHTTFPGSGTTAGWIPVGIYTSPQAGANAVADGVTGELDWDQRGKKEARETYLFHRWHEIQIPSSHTPSPLHGYDSHLANWNADQGGEALSVGPRR
jgi:hypothetical protein